MRRHLSLVLLLLSLSAAAIATAGEHPVEGDLVSIRERSPTQRSVRFRATNDPAIDPALAPDPRTVGATFEVIGQTAAGDGSNLAVLPAANWTALGSPPGAKGFKFRDPDRVSGVKTVIFKPGSRGGKLVVNSGGAAWDYAIDDAQAGPVHVRFTIGPEIYCARFDSFRRNEPGKVIAKLAAAPAHCNVCGNDSTEAPVEECDDGNLADGDGCSAACQLEDPSARCAGMPTTAGTSLDKALVASGLTQPVFVTSPPLDPNRLFVVQRKGQVRVIENGVLLAQPFLDLTGGTGSAIEDGAYSMAFDPDYETNGYVYVSYSAPASAFSGICALAYPGGGDNVVARYQVSANPNVADAGSAVVVLNVDQPGSGHKGGLVAFGPDGFLYLAVGDGANPGDQCEVAQNDLSPLGKLLRVDTSAALPADPAASIWAKGFRNPWRFSFDSATGDLYVGDVGQAQWEEITYVPAASIQGTNFQWDNMEGRHCYEPNVGCDTSGTPPALEYAHGPGCSVSGGYVYRGCALPDLHGTYFYSDYCDSVIRSFNGVSGGDAQNLLNHPELDADLDAVVSFGQDARGEVYIVDFGNIPGSPGLGQIFRIVGATP